MWQLLHRMGAFLSYTLPAAPDTSDVILILPCLLVEGRLSAAPGWAMVDAMVSTGKQLDEVAPFSDIGDWDDRNGDNTLETRAGHSLLLLFMSNFYRRPK